MLTLKLQSSAVITDGSGNENYSYITYLSQLQRRMVCGIEEGEHITILHCSLCCGTFSCVLIAAFFFYIIIGNIIRGRCFALQEMDQLHPGAFKRMFRVDEKPSQRYWSQLLHT